MKIRLGFVSNSSSSSFLINGTVFNKEKIQTYIQMLLDAQNVLNDTTEIIDDICHIKTEENSKRFFEEVSDFTGEKLNSSYFEKYDGPVVIVDSVSDNSIPFSIQYSLENISIMRQHWG